MEMVEPKNVVSSICDPGQLPDGLLESDRPVLLKGLVANWPLVDAAKQSADAADSYLRKFYNGRPVTVSPGPGVLGNAAGDSTSGPDDCV